MFSALQVVKGVAIGITQSFQFFGLHTFCPQNIWPQTPVRLSDIYGRVRVCGCRARAVARITSRQSRIDAALEICASRESF